jgi:hypothetical protein
MKGVLIKSIFFFFLVFTGWEAFGQCPTTQPAITSGSGTFTVPANVTSIIVETWGGGGKGGGSSSSGTYGGGGGGGYSRSTLAVTPGQIFNYNVGAGSTDNNNPGGNSWFSLTNEAVAIVRALGGSSVLAIGNTGAAGGALGTGDIMYAGGNGADGGTNGGGGGSSAGTGANGNNATDVTGATAPTGGGNGGNGNSVNGNGNNGFSPGGGGGGAKRTTGNPSGGNGGNGQIIITTIIPANTVSSPSSTPTQCINTALTAITHTTTGATGISNAGVPGANGLPAGVSAAWAGNTITISGTPTASGTFNYSIPLTGGCNTPAVNATGTITVTPNNTASVPSSTPTLCINTALTAITHSTTGATGIGAATGLPAGVTAAWAGNTITISGTPAASGTFNYSIPLTGGCNTPAVNASGTITVTPNNTVSAPSSTPTLCINNTLTAITHTTTGATGIGAATGLPAGVTASWAGNAITLSGTPTASGTFNYSIPLTGGCNTPAVNATGTITVTPNNTASAPSSTPTLCINTALTAITHSTTGATGIGASTGLPAGVTASWASNTITISGTPSVSGTFNYSIPLTGGCNTPAVIATGTITVTPNNTVSAPSSTPTLCINNALTAITHTTTGATGIGAATGLPAGVTASWAGNTITISGTPTASGTFNYSIPLTGGCNTPAVNATGTITVTPNNTVSAPSSTPTLCINNTLTAITHTTTGATGIGAATGLPAGVTASWAGNAITLSGSPTVSGTFNYSIPLTGGCGTANATGTITVNPATAITSESLAAQTICDGQNFTSISVSATGTGTVTYQWYTNTTSNNTTGTSIPGATSAAYTPPSSTIGTNYYYVIVSSDCGASVTSTISGAFTVDPITSITTQPSTADQLECFGDGFNPISVSANGANLTYQWYTNSSNSNSGGISVSGANSATFTPPSSIEGTAYYYVIVTGNCGISTSNVSGLFTVTAPVTTITQQPASTPQTICIGDSFTSISVAAIGEGTVSYQWYSNSSPSNSGGTLISGATSQTYTPLSGTVGTTYYYAVANSDCGTVPTAVSGAFTVNPLTSIDSENLPGATICEGNGPFSPISVTASGPGTLNYQWYSNTSSSNSGGSLISGANSNSYTPPSNVVGPAPVYYYVEVSSTGGCGPTKTSSVSGAFIVNPNNTASAASSTPTVCINTALPAITHTTTGATGISNSGVPGANGLPAGVSATWASNTITISGTPTASGTFNYSIPLTGGCGTVNASGTITVTPNNTASAPSSTPTLCINTALTAITHSTTGATGIGAATGLPAGVTAAWAGNTITISGTPAASGTFNYSIPLTGGCNTPAVNASGTITVTPNNTASAPSSTPTLCINTALTAITHTTTGATGVGAATGLPTGVTASWAGNTITISGTPTASGTFNYSIPLAGGCNTPAVNASGTITVTPNNTASAPSSTPTLCINTSLTAITHSTTGATGIGAATGLPAGVTAAWAGNTITISGTPTASGTFNYSIPLTGGCNTPAVNATGTITVTPNNTVSAPSSTPTLCINTALTAITHSTTGATGIGAATGLPAGVTAAWAGNTITISGTPTASGTFNYSIPLTGGCNTPAVNATGTITVTPNNTASAPSTTPTLCINTALTAITHSTTGATGIGAATGLPAGVTASWASNTIMISGTPSVSGTFNYSIPLVGCGTVNATGTITVTPNNTVSAPSSTPTLCISTPLTNITHSTTGATGIGAATGLPAGVTASWAGNTITISGTPTASGTFNYSIPLTGGCGAINATGTITVTPNMVVTSTSPNRNVCIDSPLTAINHTTTLATGIGTATGLPAGVTASWASNTITISGTPTVSGTFNYSIPLTGGCGTVNAIGTIKVDPNNTVTLAPAISPVCINTPLSSFTHTTNGSNGIANNGVAGANGLPAGVSATRSGNTITISGTPTVSGTFNYSIPLTGGCGTVYATGTITVTPNNTASAPSSSPTLCINTGLSNITHTTTGTTGISNAGVSGANGLPAGLSANWAGNVITISGTPTASGTFNYSIPMTGGCGAVNATGTITVTPDNTASAPSSTPTVCINTALTNITLATTGATGIGTASGLPSGVSAAWASNTITISGTPTASGTFNYTIPLTGGCGAVNATGTITVTPDNTVSAPSSTPTLCINTPLTNITHSSTGASGISNSGVSGANGLPAGLSATWAGNVITISGTPTASGTFNYSIPLTGGCANLFAEGTITINPATAITSESLAAQTICDGQNFTSISVSATGTGTVTYQWYTNTTSNNTTGTSIPGATSVAYTPPSSTIGTNYYYVIVSSDCGVSVTSTISGAFTVDPITSITTQPSTADQLECFGDGFDPISVSANGANLTYQWYRNPTSSNSGGISIPGANSASFTPPSNSQGVAFYYVVVTGNCGVQTSDVSGEFTVTPPITTITQDPSATPQVICIGDSFTSISVAAIGEGTVNYQWYSNSSSSNSGGTLISGATSQTYTPLSGTVGTTFYYAVANSDCGTVATAVSGAFTVNPLTSIDSENLPGATICEGNGPFSPISVTASGPGTLNYQWYSNTSNSNSGGSLISGANSNSYTPPSNVVGPAPVYYYVEVSSTGGCGPTKTSSVSGAFIVNPNNTASAASTSPTVCINTAIPTISHSTANATGISSPGVSGANGLPAGVSATWASNTITISGTPTSSGTFNYSIPLTGGCGSVNATGTITVNPDATVGPTSVGYPSVCISSPNLAPFTQPTTGVTAIGSPSGLPPGITASFNSSNGLITFSGTATTTGLYTYNIPLTGPCINGLTATGTIHVSPDYVINSVSSVSATTIGGSATVTFYADPTKMLNGTYQVEYQIKQASGAFTTVGPVNATVVNGKGTFTTSGINSTTDTYTVQILTIKKSTDVCTVTLPVPPITYFGVCSAVYGGNSTFNVPANVYSITIEVYGGGGGGGTNGGGGGGAYSIRQNIPVTPGEPIAVFVGSGGNNTGTDGGVSYVIRDSNIANQLTNSLLYANGGKGATTGNAAGGTFDSRYSGSNGDNANGSNGGKAGGPLGGAAGGDGVNGSAPGGGGGKRSGTRGIGGAGLVIISYSCPDADNTDCIKVIDDGAKSGMTVLEFTCNDTWIAPEGLAEFTVYVGSGGGGGGSGEGSGGGGSGSIIKQTFTTTSPFGLPAGATFPITVGQGGLGAQSVNNNGFSGQPSTFTGTIDGSNISISVPGGGGGGSQATNAGGTGASGGGGGASPSPAKSEGLGGTAVPITYSGTNVTVYQGNEGGNGDYSEPQNSVAGGGGGGLVPWKPLPADDGQNGKAAGNGQGEGGRGGDGIVLTLGDSIRYFGAGGGGIGRYFNGTDKIGLGGIAIGTEIRIGGSGNLSGVNPVGGNGTDKTGSGGGAGYFGGGKGGSGVVYIVYFNFRILGVEYEYFTADFNSQNRSGVLNWATTQEWENSHFEIERAVNDVRTWTKVGEVTGSGYSDAPIAYSFTDANLPAAGGSIFYRLKQVNLNGTSEYSVTRSIQVNPLAGHTNWIVYPNPTTGDPIHLELLNRSVYNDEKITVRIISATGQFETFEGNSASLLSAQLSDRLRNKLAGIYTLEISWGINREFHKIILRR